MSVSTAIEPDPTQPMSQLSLFGPDAPPRSISDAEALGYVRRLTTGHYENFSVLSRLVPVDLRDDFAAVYAYCRWCDDLGDETGGDEAARARSLELLAWWRRLLDQCFAYAGNQEGATPPSHPVFACLVQTIRKRKLTAEPFHHLIDAFEQDQRVRRYETWDQVVDYCTRSADPVGRIVLGLAGFPGACRGGENDHERRLVAMSDATCTALQLTNHWQDVRRDLLERDRVYLPSQDTGITADQLREWAEHADDPAVRVPYIRAVRPLVERTWSLFEKGRPLPGEMGGPLAPVVWLFGAGGEEVLRSIHRTGCTTLWHRPKLGKMTKMRLVLSASLKFALASRAGSAR